MAAFWSRPQCVNPSNAKNLLTWDPTEHQPCLRNRTCRAISRHSDDDRVVHCYANILAIHILDYGFVVGCQVITCTRLTHFCFISPWEILLQFQKCNIQTYVEFMSTPCKSALNIGSGNGLLSSGNDPLPDPMLSKVYVLLCFTKPK